MQQYAGIVGSKARDASRLNKLIRNAGQVIGTNLDSLESVLQDRMLAKLLLIMNNVSQPLHEHLIMHFQLQTYPAVVQQMAVGAS